MRFDPARLLESLDALPAGAWSLPSRLEQNNVHHGYSRAHLVLHGGSEVCNPFRWVLDAFGAPVQFACLSRLEPGGFILPHRDAGPYLERWHVPIITAGSWGDGFVPEPGEAHRVTHWEPHSVWNASDTARVVLLVDLDREVHPSARFEGPLPVPSKFTHLVEAAGLGPQ